MLQGDKTPEADGKLENLKKLVADIKNRNSLYEFLEEVVYLQILYLIKIVQIKFH